VLDEMAKSIHPLLKKMLAEIRDAKDKVHAATTTKRFDDKFRAKWPKASNKIKDDLSELLTFYDFPAEHCQHLKTSNPITRRPSRPCGSGPRSPRAWDHKQPDWRCGSSSSLRRRNGDARSTGRTSSLSCALELRSERVC